MGRASRFRANHQPWTKRPDLLARIIRVWESFLKNTPIPAIAEDEGVSYITVWRDIQRARLLALAIAANDMEELNKEAIARRQIVQAVAFRDHEIAARDDASGRAALLRIVGENQTAIEELAGLRHKGVTDGAVSLGQPTMLIQIGTSKERRLAEMSDDELTDLKRRLSGNGQQQLTEGA